MSFKPLTTIRSRAVCLPVDHIDTDQIIPARFLKATTREGFGKSLFDGWRYRPDGSPNPDFVLNTPRGQGEILISGENFGCGSSREHAAWALYDYGFRVVIARSFADIFRNNALNNGMLPVELPAGAYEQVLRAVQDHPDIRISVDLPAQTLRMEGLDAMEFAFEINPFRKQCLLEGTDLVDFLVTQRSEIAAFEKQKEAV